MSPFYKLLKNVSVSYSCTIMPFMKKDILPFFCFCMSKLDF